MSFVFVSHASPDKMKIRHIVEALIEAGEKVWLDNPAAMGYGEVEINRYFYRIRAGGRWRDEIDEALRQAGAVLVCWSEHSKEDRRVWHSEATYARVEKKLLSCRIDDVEVEELPDDFHEEQIIDLRLSLPREGQTSPSERWPRNETDLKAHLRLFLLDVRATINKRAAKRLQSGSLRDPFLPYLIDRTDQETIIGRAIEEVAASGGTKPFIIMGPENECPDEFLERLRRYTSVQRIGAAWHEIAVEWPQQSAHQEFALEFGQRLATSLRLRGNPSLSELAKAIGQLGRTTAVISLMRAEEWKRTEPTRIKAWLSFWYSLMDCSRSVSIVPILSITTERAEPGWRNYPPGFSLGASVSNRQIWRQVQLLQKPKSGFTLFRRPPKQEGLPVDVPPVLNPVSKGDAQRWMNDHFKDTSLERVNVKNELQQIFIPKKTNKCGIALEDFVRAVHVFFHSDL